MDAQHVEAHNAKYSELDFAPAPEPSRIPHIASRSPRPPREASDNYHSTSTEFMEIDDHDDHDDHYNDNDDDDDIDGDDNDDSDDDDDNNDDDDAASAVSEVATLLSDEGDIEGDIDDEINDEMVTEALIVDEIMEDYSNQQGLLHTYNIQYLQPPEPGVSIPPASPIIRQLDDVPEARVVDWHETAGAVLPEGVEPNIRERWENLFGAETEDLPNTGYAPFSSRLDWEIAHWAVKENIGQGSLNRLLAIPEVWIIFVFSFPPS